MPKTVNPFMDFVFGLDDTQYDLLCDCVNQRNDKKLYGFSSYEEAALYYKRLCHNKQLINSHFYRGVSELPYKLEFESL
ncbi:MAG: hypothetical protein MR457_00445 [Solobacterium sp.]|nr:hypothetical protein [Solobacterium sp.]